MLALKVIRLYSIFTPKNKVEENVIVTFSSTTYLF